MFNWNLRRTERCNLDRVYKRRDSFPVFTRDLLDPVRIGSAIWYQVDPLIKVIPYGTVPFQFRTGPV